MTKICKRCENEKISDQFCKDKSRKDGLYPYCRDCAHLAYLDNQDRNTQRAKERYKQYPEGTKEIIRERIRKWNLENADRRKFILRRAHIKRCYGLSEKDFEALLDSQDRKCAICRTSDPGDQWWHVDHKHVDDWKKRSQLEKRSLVRGILCRDCNLGLGRFKDSPESLRAAAAYLENFSLPSVVSGAPYAS